MNTALVFRSCVGLNGAALWVIQYHWMDGLNASPPLSSFYAFIILEERIPSSCSICHLDSFRVEMGRSLVPFSIGCACLLPTTMEKCTHFVRVWFTKCHHIFPPLLGSIVTPCTFLLCPLAQGSGVKFPLDLGSASSPSILTLVISQENAKLTLDQPLGAT
jgi:hypothetical protein